MRMYKNAPVAHKATRTNFISFNKFKTTGAEKRNRYLSAARCGLFLATALTGSMMAFQARATIPEVTIDGTDETVIGTGGGTQASPWDLSSTQLNIGDTAESSSLTISAGGIVEVDKTVVGYEADGSAVVTGAGSQWINNDRFVVGNEARGEMTVSAGATVTSNETYLGMTGDGAGTLLVTGAGTSWTDSGSVWVGFSGAGEMTVSDGASLHTDGYIVAGNQGDGSIIISDGARVSTDSNVIVGWTGSGALTVAGGATLTVAGRMDLAYEDGSSGTLIIGAAAGDDAVAPGTLEVGTVLFSAGLAGGESSTGAIVFNHTSEDYEFAANLMGTGTLESYSGYTSLTGDLTDFSGTMEVYGGNLSMNTTFNGAVAIEDGGTLSGSGKVSSAVVKSGGAVSPGNSIGTLEVTGDITFDAGSTYVVEIDSDGNSDLVTATGNAVINGGTVQIVPYPDYALDTTYTILTTGGTVTGTFDDLETLALSAFLSPELSYTANAITFTIIQTVTFESIAETENEKQVAEWLDSLGVGNDLWNAVVALGTVEEARESFNTLTGEIHASVQSMLIEDSYIVRDVLSDRLKETLEENGEEGENTGIVGWGKLFGTWGHHKAEENAAEFDRDHSGFFLGMDARFMENWSAGFFVGYGQMDFDSDDRKSSGDADGYHAGAYTGTRLGNLRLKLAADFGWQNIITDRQAIVGEDNQYLRADYDSSTIHVFADAGYSMEVGEMTFEPFAGVAYVRQHLDGFSEFDGTAALTAGSETNSNVISTIGLRVASGEIALGATHVRLLGSAGWSHTFGDLTPEVHLNFAGGESFAITGTPLSENTFFVDAGVAFDLGGAELELGYHGEYSSDMTDHAARAALSWAF
ncbi:autotransporter outer membrane beta-barrel domain-containing protein [Emcibacter sp.]|uniref:autotransporter outer membrane beta-barrel domain-containing protein n=1 Tax=Emcibacter sp. TaxID=1979954 RepID=UPI003A8D08A6